MAGVAIPLSAMRSEPATVPRLEVLARLRWADGDGPGALLDLDRAGHALERRQRLAVGETEPERESEHPLRVRRPLDAGEQRGLDRHDRKGQRRLAYLVSEDRLTLTAIDLDAPPFGH